MALALLGAAPGHIFCREVLGRSVTCNWLFVIVILLVSFCVVICTKSMNVCLTSLLQPEGVCCTRRKFEMLSLPSSYHRFNHSTRKHPVTSPKPSFSALHAQSPTFPHSCYICLGQCIEDPLHNPHRTLEPATGSSPAERSLQYDQKLSCRPPTLLGQSEYVKDNLTLNRDKSSSVRRSDRGFR